MNKKEILIFLFFAISGILYFITVREVYSKELDFILRRQYTIYTFSKQRVAISNSYAGLYELIYTDNNTQYMKMEIWSAVQEQYN